MEQKIKQLEQKLNSIYKEIYFARIQWDLFCELYNKQEEHNYIWGAMIDAMEYSALIKLSKVYEKRNDTNNLIKLLNDIKSLGIIDNNNLLNKVEEIKKKITENDSVGKLIKQRNKRIAHIDIKYIWPKYLNPNSGFLSIKEVPILLDNAITIITDLYKIVFDKNINFDRICSKKIKIEIYEDI